MSQEAQQPTQHQETLPEIRKIESIKELAEKHVPRMIKGRDKCVALITEILENGTSSEEEAAEHIAVLAKVRDQGFNVIEGLRKEITGPMDDLKKFFMQFERPLSDDKDSLYTKAKNQIADFRQRELDRKKKIEEEAARKKERENHLVDITAQVHKNLNDMVLRKTKDGDSASAKYFSECTLENFDSRADKYNKMKPTLKIEEYDACFSSRNIPFNKSLFTDEEINDIITTLKQVETFEKWTEEVITAATPIINQWRAKIPDLKQNLINLQNAKDESERTRIAEEQRKKEEEEAARRNAELEQQALDKSRDIDANAGLSKMENSFVEQATIQQAGDAGQVKYVLKFKDHKSMPKAFMEIVYQCLAHKDFKGIQKRDKKGNLVYDDKGRPEYTDEVQRWINFFLSHCDAAIDGTVVFEDSKVTVR